MADENTAPCECGTGAGDACCRIEAIVSIDDRGQLVLPKDVRTKLGLAGGDKLAVVTYGGGEETCCLTLVRADSLGDAVRGVLGPLMEGK